MDIVISLIIGMAFGYFVRGVDNRMDENGNQLLHWFKNNQRRRIGSRGSSSRNIDT